MIAWRDRLVPAVRREIDCGSPSHSLVSTDRRVSSPSAANTDAGVFGASGRLWRLSDMPRDILDLLAPPALVHAEGFDTALARHFVEARFDDAQQRPGRGLFQRELDEGRRLAGIILALIVA